MLPDKREMRTVPETEFIDFACIRNEEREKHNIKGEANKYKHLMFLCVNCKKNIHK